MHWYAKVLSNYAVFRGRARRTEFWMFYLINYLILLILGSIELMMGIPAILSVIYCIGVLIPNLAVSVRRLHDTGRSGWWLLISLIPFIGVIILLVFWCLDSQEGTNEYGPNPKEAAES